MKSIKDVIRKVLKSSIDLKYRIKVVEPTQDSMKRKLFIEIIEQLKRIEERRDFLDDEIGIDMTAYEDKFFAVIENLLKLAFSKKQLALIQLYLYQLVPDEEWDGTITLTLDNIEKKHPFKSPVDVWNVLQKCEN